MEMSELEKKVNEINEKYFLPLLSPEMWQEDYVSDEFQQAKSFLEPYLPLFGQTDPILLTQIFKSQIKYFKWTNANYEKIDDEEYKTNSLRHNEYRKMIPQFLRVMRCFQFAIASDDIRTNRTFVKRTKLFEITRVTFEGKAKDQKIVLEGQILNIIREFFEVLGRIETEDQLRSLKIFSENLYYSFWDIWFDHIKKLSKVKPGPPLKNKIQFQNFLRNTKAFQLHKFLTDYSGFTKADSISEKEKRFIGNFFLLVKLVQDEAPDQPFYLDTTHYNDVRNWVLRGNYFK